MNFSNVRLNCIKGIPIDNIYPKPLHELGFPLDAPKQPNLLHDSHWNAFYYKLSETPFSVIGSVEKIYVDCILKGMTKEDAFNNTLIALKEFDVTAEELIAGLKCGCVYGLSESDIRTLLEEFLFIIETLLPRQLSDIYYSFDIQSNPAHSTFFDLAAEKLDIERYSNRNQSNYGQFIKYPSDGIKQRIASGETFQSIYRKTCATKQMISEAWSEICKSKPFADKRVYHLRKIEFALFKLSRQFRYTVINGEEACGSFAVYNSEDKRILTISYLSEKTFCAEFDYDKACSDITQSEQTLVIDFDELENNSYVSSVIRAAIEDEKFIKNHSVLRNDYFTYERAFDDCECNYDAISTANRCGCFSCLSIFNADRVDNWDLFSSACCPFCGNTTLIADNQGYRLSKDFLCNVKRHAELNDELEDIT